MKKFPLLLIVTILLSHCSQRSSASFRIPVSFYPIFIITKNVVGDVPGIKIETLAPPTTGCLHDYAITSNDMARLEKADIFVINGAGMESYLEKAKARYPKLVAVELTKGITLIRDEDGVNPHAWVSISNAQLMTERCASALANADPKNAASYIKNGKRYSEKLSSLKKEFDAAMKPFKGKKIVTFHEAFPYFAQEYGLDIVAVIEREPGSEPSAKELADTIRTVKKSGVKVLFTEPQYPSQAAYTVARETGASVFILDPAVTGEDSADAYIRIMKRNLSVLKEAFSN